MSAAGPMAGLAEQPFWDALALILEHVRRELFRLPNRLQVPPAPDEEFDLSSLPARVRVNLPYETSAQRLYSQLLRGADTLLLKANAALLDAEVGDVEPLYQSLAGAWLGLYFLGAPFVHPWEPVARHAERNGYHRGPAAFKAAGDVYREARRRKAAVPAGESSKEPEMLVVDLNPLAIRHLADSGRTAPQLVLAALGACYELMQMRLYIRSGGSIDHFVFRATLLRILQNAPAPAHERTRADELWDLARLSYGLADDGKGGNPRQRVVVIEPSADILQMPSCVLSTRAGVFRSPVRSRGDSASGDTYYGANANRLPDAQQKLYRTLLLGRGVQPHDEVVTSASKMQFLAFCRGLLDPAANEPRPPPSAPADAAATQPAATRSRSA